MRGDGRIFPRRGSNALWCAYYLRGKEHRESTGTSDPDRAGKYLKRRLREVGADLIGAKQFVGPAAERIKISELLDALKADYELRGKWSERTHSTFKKVREYFGLWKAVQVSSEAVASWQLQLREEGYKDAYHKPFLPSSGPIIQAGN